MRAVRGLQPSLRTIMKKKRTEARSDTDVRGEHGIAPRRLAVDDLSVEEVVRKRRRGHYAAGADGTQDVVASRTQTQSRRAPVSKVSRKKP